MIKIGYTQQEILRLVAVVVTFNRLEQLKKTLAAVLSESCVGIVVVDNGSTDGTIEWLSQQKDARLRIEYSPTNLGGAGGFERGIRISAEELDPNWIVVMDDDGRPHKGAFEQFARLEKENLGIVVAATYFPDGNICEMNRPSRNPFWYGYEFAKTVLKSLIGQGRMGFHIPDAAYLRNEVTEVDAGSFVGLFISCKSIERIGYPEGKLFIYGDDVSYCLKARKEGIRIGFAPIVKFEHACSTLRNEKVYQPYWKIYYNYRNGIITYRQVAGIWFWFLAPFIVTKWVVLVRHYGSDKRLFLKILWKALKDGFSGHLGVTHDEILMLSSCGDESR